MNATVCHHHRRQCIESMYPSCLRNRSVAHNSRQCKRYHCTPLCTQLHKHCKWYHRNQLNTGTEMHSGGLDIYRYVGRAKQRIHRFRLHRCLHHSLCLSSCTILQHFLGCNCRRAGMGLGRINHLGLCNWCQSSRLHNHTCLQKQGAKLSFSNHKKVNMHPVLQILTSSVHVGYVDAVRRVLAGIGFTLVNIDAFDDAEAIIKITFFTL